MNDAPENIREIDLMAYADGLLEGDAARRAAVEAHLTANRADAARVRAIMRDNTVIRALYAGELERPTPPHLLRIVREPGRRKPPFSPRAIAAGLVLASLAATSGWLVGQRSGSDALPPTLVQALASHHAESGAPPVMSAAIGQAANGALLAAPANTGWIEVPLPDLSANGFELVERNRVVVADESMIRVIYRSGEETLNLFMRVRPEAGGGVALQSNKTDGLTVVNWSSGPLSYALTTSAPAEEAAHLAAMVRGAIGDARFADPPPMVVPEQGESVAGDGLLGTQQPAETIPAPVQPSQFN